MPRNTGLSMAEAKLKVLDLIGQGFTVKDAMDQVGRTAKSMENWRSADRDFAAKVDEVRERLKRAQAAGKDEDVANLGFAAFRKRFLGYDTYEHQQQWVDVLEGKDPQPLSGCEWDPSNRKRVIINVPPGHSKSSTITVDYVTWKICMNPNVRIVIVSKRQEQARKFLYQIKQRLTSNLFAELQAAYAPPDGFRPGRGEGTFAANTIYINGRDSDAKDPTVEVLGMGGQIYGTRSDLIILDDCVVGSNANEYDKQVEWLESEVESRVKNGSILIVGTRLRTTDLYSELRRGERYNSGKTPWSYLRQPMVREFADDPKDWVTLWPKSSTGYDESDREADERGEYVMFDGPTCSRTRDAKPPATWALVYQQQQVAEDATFNPIAVAGSMDRRRKIGPLTVGAWGHPRGGMENKHVIGSIDPAGTGLAFILIYAVDRTTKHRWVLNAFTRDNTVPSWYAEQIEQLTPEYSINEWVIESNAYASWLIHDERIRAFTQSRGVRITPHYTSKNKQDPDFGVASIASLFGTTERIHEGTGREVHKGDNIIHLPDQNTSAGIKALCDQLIAWQPGRLGRQLRQDGPMALWFAELVARRVLGFGSTGLQRQVSHASNRYLSRGDRAKQIVVPRHVYDRYAG
jgi:hypothetical protein